MTNAPGPGRVSDSREKKTSTGNSTFSVSSAHPVETILSRLGHYREISVGRDAPSTYTPAALAFVGEPLPSPLQWWWMRCDEYYWKHAVTKHTISVAHVGGEARYTLWAPGDGPGRMLGSDTDIDALKRLHEEAVL